MCQSSKKSPDEGKAVIMVYISNILGGSQRNSS